MKNIFCAAFTVLVLCSLGAAAADPAKLVGTWKFEKTALGGKVAVYFTLNAKHACAQVAKASMFGVTRWKMVECQWTLDGGVLTLTITGPASEPDIIGKVSKATVSGLSDQSFTLTADGNSQTWTRVTEVPIEFASRFPKLDASRADRDK